MSPRQRAAQPVPLAPPLGAAAVLDAALAVAPDEPVRSRVEREPPLEPVRSRVPPLGSLPPAVALPGVAVFAATCCPGGAAPPAGTVPFAGAALLAAVFAALAVVAGVAGGGACTTTCCGGLLFRSSDTMPTPPTARMLAAAIDAKSHVRGAVARGLAGADGAAVGSGTAVSSGAVSFSAIAAESAETWVVTPSSPSERSSRVRARAFASAGGASSRADTTRSFSKGLALLSRSRMRR